MILFSTYPHFIKLKHIYWTNKELYRQQLSAFCQIFLGHTSINLRRADKLVPKEFLDLSDVATLSQQLRADRVP